MKEFKLKPASWLPYCEPEIPEYVRNIKREDIEYTNKTDIQ